MIVIIGSGEDLCNLLIYQYMCQHQVEVVFIKESELLTAMGINWPLAYSQGEGFFTIASRKIPFSTISGVLFRLQNLPATITDMTQEDQQYVRCEWDATIMGWLHGLDCPVLNRPLPGLESAALYTNVDNIWRVLACGFQLPAAMVTSSYASACQFYDRCGQHVLLRTSPWQRPWQLIEGAAGRQALPAILAKQPVYMQDIPMGQWYQVFTVGNRAFGGVAPAGCFAQEGSQLSLQPCVLAEDIQERCCRLARAFHVDFAQISLLRTPENAWYCFDASTFPVYTQCETSLQEAITMALADLLISGDRSAAHDFTLWHARRPNPGIRVSMP